MSSESPLSAAARDDAPAASSSNVRTKSRSANDSSWLDVLKKLWELIQEIIPLIKKCFGMAASSSSRSNGASNVTAKTTKDILTQLANLLPTSTFMTFQLIAPLATNNGHCGNTEKIVTGTLLGVFAAMIAITSFTDSVKISSTGKVYYGLVTAKGLWNPAFKGSGIPGVEGSVYTSGGKNYALRGFDFVNALMSLAAFAALSLLSDPVSSCFFKNLSSTVVKSVPLIVSAVIAFLLSFAPAARNGVGFRVDGSVRSSASTTHSSLLHHEPAHSPAHSTVGIP